MIITSTSFRTKSAMLTFDAIINTAISENVPNISDEKIILITWSKEEEIEDSMNLIQSMPNYKKNTNIKKYYFNYMEYNKGDIEFKKSFIKDMIFNIFNYEIPNYNLDRFYKLVTKYIDKQKQLEPVLPRANKHKRKQIQNILKNYNKNINIDFYKKEYEKMIQNEK